jgi:hypothetical protein
MTTKKISKIEMRRKFYKFLSDNDRLTEFNKNFSDPEQTDRRKNWGNPTNKAKYFSQTPVGEYISRAFLWSASPQSTESWENLSIKWNNAITEKVRRG